LTSFKPRKWRTAVIPFFVGAAMLAAGCGSDSSSDSSTSAAGGSTQKAITGWTGSTQLPNATIGILSGTHGAEVVQHWESTAFGGVKALGWKYNYVDGKNDPKIWGQAISAFTQQKVDGIIIIGGLQLSTFAVQLKAAKAAGIPIIHVGVETTDPQKFLDGDYAPDDAQFGVVLGQYLAKKLPAASQYVTLSLEACAACNAPVPAAVKVLNEAGHKQAGTADMNLNGDLAAQATKLPVDLIRAHPEAKALISCCDFTATFSVPRLAQSGSADVLNTVRYDDLSVLALIRAGKPVVTVANNNDDFILTGVDQLAKHLATKAPIDPDAAPDSMAKYVVVDKDNVPASGFYFKPEEAIARFTKKWQAEYKR
jgi:ABC-type sugar transport system substrate-binding protein